jgi:RES domain-containing protein
LLVAIEAWLDGMLDLTSLKVRRALGVTLETVAEEDWRKLLHAGQESSAQALGRAAATNGASGLTVRSATGSGINVAIFPGAHRADRLTVVEGDRLARLGVRLRA